MGWLKSLQVLDFFIKKQIAFFKPLNKLENQLKFDQISVIDEEQGVEFEFFYMHK